MHYPFSKLSKAPLFLTKKILMNCVMLFEQRLQSPVKMSIAAIHINQLTGGMR